MTVSDPLLKTLKGIVSSVVCQGDCLLKDGDPRLARFCGGIEQIFYQGLLPQKNAIGFYKPPECWTWVEKFSNSKYSVTYPYEVSVKRAKKCLKVRSNFGRMRLFIRSSLVLNSLVAPLQVLARERKVYSYYTMSSIIGDEILREMFMSLLDHCRKIKFELDLENSMFLDETWELPKMIHLELVPCDRLGLSILFADSRAVIVKIEENSVASERSEIQVGDIVDTLNDYFVNINLQGQFGFIIRKHYGQPVRLSILKTVSGGNVYPPFIKMLAHTDLDLDVLKNRDSINTIEDKTKKKSESSFYFLSSVGNLSQGDVKQIPLAIEKVIDEGYKLETEVIFETTDLGVKVFNKKDKNRVC